MIRWSVLLFATAIGYGLPSVIMGSFRVDLFLLSIIISASIIHFINLVKEE